MLPTPVSARLRAARTVALFAALPCLAVLGASASSASAAPITLVKAINTSTGDATPSNVAAIGTKGYFLASAAGSSHDSTADDLYVTDGTSGGTSLLTTLPHPAVDEQPETLVGTGDTIYFGHTSTLGGTPRLWSTDGTGAGTGAVTWTPTSGADTDNIVVVAASGDDLYFTGTPLTDAGSIPTAQTLYRLPHASSTAQVIARVSNGGTIGNVTPTASGTVFFTEDTFSETSETHQLWRTDGTSSAAPHTVQLPATAPFGLHAVGSRLYYEDNSAAGAFPDAATQVWTNDGTSLTDDQIDFGSATDAPVGVGQLVASSDALYLTGYNPSPDDPSYNAAQSIWKVQGTAPTRLTDGTAVPGPALVGTAGTSVFFTADSAPSHLYASTGGTPTAIQTEATGAVVSGLGTDGTSFFYAVNGSTLWSSTGSTPTQLTSTYSEVDNTLAGAAFIKIGVNTFFDNKTTAEGAELWATGGASATTRLVKDIDTEPQDAKILHTVTMGGKAYFIATDGTAGDELWSSDGTSATLVSTLQNNGGSTVSRLIATAHGLAITTGDGLWWSDGTTTRLLSATTDAEGGFAYDPTAFGDRVAFNGPGVTTPLALWLTDGTDAGTHRVVDLPPDPTDPSYEPQYTAAGTQLYFLGYDAAHGYETWHSDGTAAGTGLTKDIVPGTAGTTLLTAAAVGNHLVFDAPDVDGVQRMWQTNAAGTDATPLTSAAFAVAPSNIVSVGADVFFTVDNQLWRVDGHADLCPLVQASQSILSIVPFGTGVAYVDASGALTLSGGTAATTSVIHQFKAGQISEPILATGAGLWMAESDATTATGTELWHSDGTAAGTALVGDLATGASSSTPAGLGVAGTSVVFSATDGTRGRQLYGTALGRSVSGPTDPLPACKPVEPTPTPTPTATPAPTPVVSVPTPTPIPTPVAKPAKVTPASLTAKVASKTDKKSPYEFTFSGVVTLPAGAVAKTDCVGTVLVQIKRGKTLVVSKSAPLVVSSGACRYKVTLKLPKKAVKKKKSGALAATISFAGSANLNAAKSPKAIALRYGH